MSIYFAIISKHLFFSQTIDFSQSDLDINNVELCLKTDGAFAKFDGRYAQYADNTAWKNTVSANVCLRIFIILWGQETAR